MDQDKSTTSVYKRCKLKKFPQIFTFKGNKYIIEEKHKKYLKMPINPIFITLDDNLTPIPVDPYANVVKMKDKNHQLAFSKMLTRMNPREKVNRTLSVSP